MAWKRAKENARIKKSQFVLTIVLTLILVAVGVYFWKFYKKTEPKVVGGSDSGVKIVNTVDENSTITSNPEFDVVGLQNVVDSWVESTRGVSSVVITDISGNVLAERNPTQVYFAASIYKLYVAYAGYRQIDNGGYDRNEVYVNGFTRYECLDKMIRESYSPCAEKLWIELGKAEQTNQLKIYGIDSTSLESITSTARDASIMLKRIVNGEGLSDESKSAYLSSMKDQETLYRRGLPSGFKNAIVYNKVGWSELKEWHDTAIVELPDGRKLIVSVFTENVGSANIAKLGTALEASLSE